MRQLGALCSLISAVGLCLLCHTVSAQLTIRRNSQDCIYPTVAAGAERLWPTSAYLPRGNSIRRISGGFLVDSTAGFSIEYYSTYKVITNKLANEKYLMYHCGTGIPNPLPAGVTKVFQGPLTSASVADATAADFMTQMLVMDRVSFASELAVSGCLQAISACGYIAPSGQDTTGSPIRSSVDSFWEWGFGPSADTMSISFNAPAATKPLDRVKWGAYVGAFFNKEFTANALYTDVRRAYTSLRRSALAQRGDPPLVCWAYKDWNNNYAMSYSKYKVEYVLDAGGVMYDQEALKQFGMVPDPPTSTTNLVFKTDGSVDNVASKWAGVLSQCDVIIDESWVMSTGGLTAMDGDNPDGFLQTYKIQAYASQIPAVTNKAVYSLAGTTGVPITRGNSPLKGYVGLDWFESGVSRAEVVLRDLVKVIRPNTRNSQLNGWQLKYLLRLDGVQQQQRVPAVCNLSTAKLINCQRSRTFAARICPNMVRNCGTGAVEYPAMDKRCEAVTLQGQVRRSNAIKNPGQPDCAARSP